MAPPMVLFGYVAWFLTRHYLLVDCYIGAPANCEPRCPSGAEFAVWESDGNTCTEDFVCADLTAS